MSILELTDLYYKTTKPSEIKKAKLENTIDVMVKIRHFLDMQERNKLVRKNQLKRLAVAG